MIKVSIYRAAGMTQELCEAAQIAASPLAFSLGCAVIKTAIWCRRARIAIVTQAEGLPGEPRRTTVAPPKI